MTCSIDKQNQSGCMLLRIVAWQSKHTRLVLSCLTRFLRHLPGLPLKAGTQTGCTGRMLRLLCKWRLQISATLDNAMQEMQEAGAELVHINLTSVISYGDDRYGGALSGLNYFESPRELARCEGHPHHRSSPCLSFLSRDPHPMSILISIPTPVSFPYHLCSTACTVCQQI